MEQTLLVDDHKNSPFFLLYLSKNALSIRFCVTGERGCGIMKKPSPLGKVAER